MDIKKINRLKSAANRSINYMKTKPPVCIDSVDSLIYSATNIFDPGKYVEITPQDIEWAIGCLLLADLRLRDEQ